MLAVVTINWMQIIQWLLIVFGGMGTAGLGVKWYADQLSEGKKQNPSPAPDGSKPEDPTIAPKRSADASPPEGAQAWVLDIDDAMGEATAESKLASLRAGETRDQARSRRIAELEGRKDAVKTA